MQGNRISAAMIVSAALLAFEPASAQVFEWVNPGVGDWDEAANWRELPSTFSIRRINYGGTAQKRSVGTSLPSLEIGETYKGSLHILAPGTLDTELGRLGAGGDSQGHVLISGSGARWSVSNDLLVGNSGTGILELRDGASLIASGASFWLARNGRSRGEVNAAGSSVIQAQDIDIAGGGSAIFSLASGSRVSSDNVSIASSENATGELRVSGNDTVWESSGQIDIANFGSALVRIEDRAYLNAFSAVIGLQSMASGTLALSDGARAEFSRLLNVGVTGTGTLEVSDSSLTTGPATLGSHTLGNGTARIGGSDASWTVNGDLRLATRGTASLTVENGGALTSGDALVADWEEATAAVIVQDSGSIWRANDLIFGRSGTADLVVRDGGRVEASASMRVGLSHLGSASIEVTGSGSALDVAEYFLVGFASPVVLTVENGGRVRAGRSTLRSEEAVATASVVGAGSLWETGSSFDIGNGGTARLSILGGATVLSEHARAGISSRGPSDVLVDGAGSSWRVQGSFVLGFLGTGNLTVRNGARLELGGTEAAGTLELGDSFGAEGTVNIGGGQAPGFLLAGSIVGGEGIARIVLDHTSPSYALTPDGTTSASPVIIKGTTKLDHIGPGTTSLPGDHSYTGNTTVTRGMLRVEGSTTSPTVVSGSGTLGGSGAVHEAVTVNAGGTVSPGAPLGALTVGSLSLDSQARLSFQLAAPGQASDLIEVTENLILDGVLDIANAGGLGIGEYTLIRYGGTLVNRGLRLGGLPPGFQTSQFSVDTSQRGLVRLRVGEVASPGPSLQSRLFFVNPGSNAQQQSFIRIINPTPERLDVLFSAFDDEGVPAPGGPVTASLPAQSSLQLTSQDLEFGNASKGLDGKLGDGSGKWQLVIDGTVPFEAMSLIRTPDGFLTNVSELVPATGDGHEVYFANPPGNTVQQSFIRVVNRGDESGTVVVSAVDDTGNPAPQGPISFELGPRAALNFNSEDYSFGNVQKGLTGGLGLGSGKWRLRIESTLDLAVMSLIRNPDGFVTSVGTVAPSLDEADEGRLLLSVEPSRLPDRQGFLRLVNPGAATEIVTLSAVDDEGRSGAAPVDVELAAFSAVQLVAGDLESGNPDKQANGGFGSGSGRWHVDARPLDRIEAMSLMRLPGGFLSNLSAVAPQSSPVEATVWFFNPGQNQAQRSMLRIVNRNDAFGTALIEAIDDTGAAAPGGPVTVELLPLAAAELSAADLEEGNPALGVEGALGTGTGKWRLHIEADVGIYVQSLLESPGGFLTDLSQPAPRN
jgi:T5SS/PEP-CTERM-associated repeat protein/autotransporter-associated beta strand protein